MPRIDVGVHQVEHGAEPTGGHADLMELFRVFSPEVLLEQLLQARQTDLKGAMKQDRQFGRVHPMILDATSESEKLT